MWKVIQQLAKEISSKKSTNPRYLKDFGYLVDELKTMSGVYHIYKDLLVDHHEVLSVRQEGDAYIIEIGKYLHSQSFSTIYTLKPKERP